MKKGGQVTKLIILVKICYKLCHSRSKNIFDKVISWPQRFCLFAMLLLIGLCTFFTPKVFLFSISLLFVNKYHYFVEAYKQMVF